MAKSKHNLINIWELSSVSRCSCSCLHPLKWKISCYVNQSKKRVFCSFTLSLISILDFTNSSDSVCPALDSRRGAWDWYCDSRCITISPVSAIWQCDGLWLVESHHVSWILASDWPLSLPSDNVTSMGNAIAGTDADLASLCPESWVMLVNVHDLQTRNGLWLVESEWTCDLWLVRFLTALSYGSTCQ